MKPEHVAYVTWSVATRRYVAGCHCGWTSDREHMKEAPAQREAQRHASEAD